MNTSYHCRRLQTIMRPITQHTLNYFPRWSNNKHFIIVVMPGSWLESILLSSGPGWELCLRGRCRPRMPLFRFFCVPPRLVIIDESGYVSIRGDFTHRHNVSVTLLFIHPMLDLEQQYQRTSNISIKSCS